MKDRVPAADGLSLRDFDLKTRLFKHRCSYMIYSPLFQKQPDRLREAVYARLREHLAPGPASSGPSRLPDAEKQTVLRILKETLPDFATLETHTR